MQIAVAGSSGFVGTRLISHLAAAGEHSIVALSRSGSGPARPMVEPRAADFFSLYSAEKALADADVGIYLLHSMTPSNRLSQGRFEDFDFILADNFARAAKKANLKHIIYVGGLIDEQASKLSRHLSSRLEVERILASYCIPVTVIRCGLVIGSEGSSFSILRKLVTRLPFMLLPRWCTSTCQPVDIDDLITVICAALDPAFSTGNGTTLRTIDCGSPETMTYRDLIRMTATAAGVHCRMVNTAATPMFMSKHWLRIITGAPSSLVYPLVESLVHPMTVRPGHDAAPEFIQSYTPVDEALRKAFTLNPRPARLFHSRPSAAIIEKSQVQSVQRLALPQGMDALNVSQYYFRWLTKAFKHILYVKTDGIRARFYLAFYPKPLLELSFSAERSARDRQLFYITGGLLALPSPRARLEFRESPDKEHIFAAIHDFRPALPWWIYRISQAVVHTWVMHAFGRFLIRAKEHNSRRRDQGQTAVSRIKIR